MYRIVLRRIGGSVGAALPREMMERCVRDGDALAIERDGEHVPTPYDPELDQTIEAFEEIRREFRNAFRELAK